MRVEHGTPRRDFARLVMDLFKKRKLTAAAINKLTVKYWKLAVITLEEDGRIGRKRKFTSPDAKWRHAGIKFRS